MHRPVSKLSALTLAAMLAASGCSASEQPSDELQVVANPVAASAAQSPPTDSAKPEGRILSGTGDVSAVAVDTPTRTLGVATDGPPTILLYNLDDLEAQPKSIPVEGKVERLTAGNGQLLGTIPTKGQLTTVTLPDGKASPTPISGEPSAAAQHGDHTLVTVRDRKAVDVLTDKSEARSISGQLYSADDVITAGNHVVVLDRLRTALFQVDLEQGKMQEGLRAGQGAANAVADSYGRVLVTDARQGALLAFSTDPLLLRQRYPVSGGVYGIAYDTQRHLAWVTLTERNEVVGYDVAGGQPTERHRFPTVRQPNSVAVDEQTGHVLIGSAAGEGTQVIEP